MDISAELEPVTHLERPAPNGKDTKATEFEHTHVSAPQAARE